MRFEWLKKRWIYIILALLLLILILVLVNWDRISETDTVQTKMKILQSIQQNELDSAQHILKEYLDSL